MNPPEAALSGAQAVMPNILILNIGDGIWATIGEWKR
jgi:hypothetical protein